jgi:hypothetical protein
MSSTLKLMCLVLLAGLLAGCQTTVTNLSVSKQPRNPTGLYPVEVEWDSTESTIRVDSIKPCVLIDSAPNPTPYPMRPTIGLSNRWETVIPVPADKTTIFYHYRFDFEYNRFGRPGKDSLRSSAYRLDIIDK